MGGSILHIGSDPAQRAMVRRLLVDDGHEVIEATDPREGVRLAVEHRPDLVLLDVDGPGMDGYETATRLRGHGELEAVPIVTLSAGADRELAISLGCDGVLEKPLDPSRFAKKVKQFLHGKRERVRTKVQTRYLEAYSRQLVAKLEAKVAELTEANDRLQLADALKNRVLANVSHELATPLTPVIGYVGLLESGRLGPLRPRQRRAVVSLAHALRRLASTVDHLLDLAALDEVALPMERITVDLAEVAREARRVLEPKARSRRVRVDLHLTTQPMLVTGDPDRLRQAVLHVLDHAIRFSPRGGAVLVEGSTDGEGAAISVYDSGEPVPAAQQPQLFEPFAGAGRRSPDAPPAPILALSLALRIVEALGGTLTVESPPRSHPDTEHDYPGAKFALRLPVVD